MYTVDPTAPHAVSMHTACHHVHIRGAEIVWALATAGTPGRRRLDSLLTTTLTRCWSGCELREGGGDGLMGGVQDAAPWTDPPKVCMLQHAALWSPYTLREVLHTNQQQQASESMAACRMRPHPLHRSSPQGVMLGNGAAVATALFPQRVFPHAAAEGQGVCSGLHAAKRGAPTLLPGRKSSVTCNNQRCDRDGV